MKARICPKCGRQNEESAWSCTGCGATLSLKSLVDLESPVPDDPLESISGFYEDQIQALRDVTADDEAFLASGHITKPATVPPYEFGFVIVTSRRLFHVMFEDDTGLDTGTILVRLAFGRRGRRSSTPRRAYLESWSRSGTPARYFALKPPTCPLSVSEIESRKLVVLPYDDVESCSLDESTGAFPFTEVQIGLKRGGQTKLTFLIDEDADKVYRSICQHVPQ